jgi:hypothetical protein
VNRDYPIMFGHALPLHAGRPAPERRERPRVRGHRPPNRLRPPRWVTRVAVCVCVPVGVESPGRVGGRRGVSPRNTLRSNRLPPLATVPRDRRARLRRPAEDTVPGRDPPPPPDPSRRREPMHPRRRARVLRMFEACFTQALARMIRESHAVIGRGTRWGSGGWVLRPLPARRTTTQRPRVGTAARVPVRSRRWSEDPPPGPRRVPRPPRALVRSRIRHAR